MRTLWLALLLAAPAFAAPPVLNLRVEMRALRQSAPAPNTSGNVVLGTRGSTPPASGSVMLSTQRDDPGEVQQVLVLNGAQASLHASRLRALPTGDWAWGGDRPGVAQTRQWIDAGRGFAVKPLWPGGRAPVTVEISAGGATRASTQLRLPFDEWVSFARFSAGVSAASREETLLQLRVSRP